MAVLPMLPVELLGLIVSHLESHRDMLSFALTSCACRQLVNPFLYRTIHIRDAATGHQLWLYLCKEPHIAETVKTLRIGHLPPLGVGALSTMKILESFSCAVRNMQRLEIFAWLIYYDYLEANLSGFNAVWDSLRECSRLRYLEIFGCIGRVPKQRGLPEFSLWKISNLVSLSIRETDRLWNLTNSEDIVGMFKGCPNLQILELTYPSDTFILSSILSQVTFPQLQVLKMSLLDCPGIIQPLQSSQRLAQFLERHITIEVLYWRTLRSPSFPSTLTSGCLPNLKKLSGSRDFVLRLLSNSMPPLHLGRPIENLCDLDLNASNAMTSLTHAVENDDLNRRTLRRLGISGCKNLADLRVVLAMFPNLTWLELPKTKYYGNGPPPNGEIKAEEWWMETLGCLPKLHTLRNAALFLPVGRMTEGARLRTVLMLAKSSVCPALRKVHWSNQMANGQVRHWEIIVERDLSGVQCYEHQTKSQH